MAQYEKQIEDLPPETQVWTKHCKAWNKKRSVMHAVTEVDANMQQKNINADSLEIETRLLDLASRVEVQPNSADEEETLPVPVDVW